MSNGSNLESSEPTVWYFGSHPNEGNLTVLRLSLYGIAMPTISVVGVAANLINLAVLRKLVQRKQASVYHVLLAMAVADLVVCGGLLVNSLVLYTKADPTLEPQSKGSPGSPAYYLLLALDLLISTSGFISNWCTAAIAAMRLLAVYAPRSASIWCTRLRARLAVLVIVGAAAIATIPLCSPYLHGKRIGSPDDATGEKEKSWRAYLLAYVVVTDLAPWLLCIVFVALLLACLRRQASFVLTSAKLRKVHRDKNKHLTVSLLSTAAWYIVMTSPSMMSGVLSFACGQSQQKTTSFIRFVYVGQVFVLMNFTGNFFFYFCMDKNYRAELRRSAGLCALDWPRHKKLDVQSSLTRRLVTTLAPAFITDDV